METNSPQADGYVMADGANAKPAHIENIHGVRCIEMFLAAKEAESEATIMPDEFFNVYDKVGPGMTNYTP